MNHLTDNELLDEIKRQWYEKGHWDWERMNDMDETAAFSPANDYFDMDVEKHIASLEDEYKRRGCELPDRDKYVSQFMPDDNPTRA